MDDGTNQGAAMASEMRLGIVGLGRRWPRWREALRGMRGEARVTVLYDPAITRAARQAETLRVPVAGGVVELLRRDDVDALILGDAWFGGWPLIEAARLNKPALCLAPPGEASGRVEVALWPALRLALPALVEVLTGPVELIQATFTGDSAKRSAALLLACTELMGSLPLKVERLGDVARCVLMTFSDGRFAQVSLAPAARTTCAISVETGGMRATLELPERLEWRDAAGRHSRTLPAGMAEIAELERFVALAREGGPDAGAVAATMQALAWLA